MTKSPSSSSSKSGTKTVLLGVTASIAAYKACDLVNLFRRKGFAVKCVMTRDAEHFITPLTLETLTCAKVVTDMFLLPETRNPLHIALAEEADIIVVAPATADIIGKVAAGICDDILTCAICATERPVLFAPAMNSKMYSNPIIRDKISYLKSKGYRFVGPIEGHLACGQRGMGHLASPENILKEAEKLLK